jgi:tetratricopeptide (TPR) repeat protein
VTRRANIETSILNAQTNLANSLQALGRFEQTLRTRQEVYSGYVKLNGKQHERTLEAANNYASVLKNLKRFDESRALLRKVTPVARRVVGEGHTLTLKMRWVYAQTLYMDPSATLDDLREAVTTLEEIERIARRVFGGAHPLTKGVALDMRKARAALRACETPPGT